MLAFVPLVAISLASPAFSQEYVSPRGFKPEIVPRQGEPQATYTLLDIWKTGPRTVVFVTKRTGPSGVNYTRREINCETMVGRTLGSSETVEGMKIDRPDPNAIVPVPGSSAQLTSTAACQAASR